jgi:hypothetical protein
MRRWIAAVVATCAFSAPAFCQFGSGTAQGIAPLPGEIVSNPVLLSNAGMRLPAAAPPAGQRIGSPLTRPYDTTDPLSVFKGTNIDTSALVAPVGTPGNGMNQPGLIGSINAKLDAVTHFFRPSTPALTTRTITPGIFRRNRERAKERMLWQRD